MATRGLLNQGSRATRLVCGLAPGAPVGAEDDGLKVPHSDDGDAREGLTFARERPYTAFVARTGRPPRERSVWAVNGVVANSGVESEDRGRRRGDRQRLMHPIHQSEPAHLARTGQVILRTRQ
jgi:hypothetical protein